MSVDEMRVWVGCLACYNNGLLVGEWVDATEAGDKTSTEIHEALIADGKMGTIDHYGPDVAVDEYGPHEELWCFDHEGFGDLLTGECSPCEAQRIAESLDGVDGDELEAFASWYEGGYDDLEDAVSDFREHWHGVWESERDFAYDWVDQGCAGESLKAASESGYFDWDSYTRDLFVGFTSHSVSSGVGVTSD